MTLEDEPDLSVLEEEAPEVEDEPPKKGFTPADAIPVDTDEDGNVKIEL